MAKFKLASEKISPRGGSGGLRPSLISSSAGGGLRPQVINPNAAGVRNTPMPVPGINVDSTLDSMTKFSAVAVNAAFEYQERKDRVIAQEALYSLSSDLRASYYGSAGENGAVQGGYGNLKETDAATGYTKYVEGVDERISDTFSKLTPRQRLMASSGIHSVRNNYLNKGAAHAAKQLTVAEEAAKDRMFGSIMDDISVGTLSIADMQAAVASYAGDEEKRSSRDKDITEHALYTVLRTEGPEQATQLAAALSKTPGVGDGKTIDSFLDTLRSDANQEEEQHRARTRFAREEKNARRKELSDAADDLWAVEASASIIRGDGSIAKVIGAIEKHMAPADAQEKVLTKLPATIQDGWDKAKAMGTTALYRKKVENQMDAIPGYAVDDVINKLDELEKRDLKEINDGLAAENKAVELEREKAQLAAHGSIDTLQQQVLTEGRDSTLVRDTADRLYKNPYLSEDQRARIDRIVNNTKNPNEEKVLQDVEDNWLNIVNRPELLNQYDVSEGKRAELKKRVNVDVATGSASIRALGKQELLGFFQLEKTLDGLQPMDYATGLNRSLALGNYTQAVTRYDALLTGFLAGPDGKKMSPGEAHQKAMASILSDETIRGGMTGLPKTEPKTYDGEGQVLLYTDDHKAVLNRFAVTELPGVEGGMNILNYAQKVDRDLIDTGGDRLAAEEMVAKQANYIYDVLIEMAENETDITKLIAIQSQIKNHAAQIAHLRTLVPESYVKSQMSPSPKDTQ